MSDPLDRHGQSKEGEPPLLDPARVRELLMGNREWQLSDSGDAISRTCRFADFHQTMAFVNAVAWIAHQENHHPALDVGYNHCTVRYSTHAIHGLSRNDFICAGKVDALLS